MYRLIDYRAVPRAQILEEKCSDRAPVASVIDPKYGPLTWVAVNLDPLMYLY